MMASQSQTRLDRESDGNTTSNGAIIAMGCVRATSTCNGRSGFEKREKRRQIRQLQNAISEGNVTAVQEMLLLDFDVDFQYNSMTSLQLAVCQGALDICKLLIAKGANVDQADARENSLLNMACWRGFADVAQLLVDSGADVDSQNEAGSTPLNVCVYKQYLSIALILITAGCNMNLADTRGRSPVYQAAQSGQLGLLQLLLDHNADPDWCDLAYNTPLMVATQAGHADIVKLLIKSGCDINKQNRQRKTALFEAASLGYTEVLSHLLSAGADPDLATVQGTTPLLEAIASNHASSCLALINSGCDVNLGDRKGWKPLNAVIRQVTSVFDPNGTKEMRDLVPRLVEAGVDVNACSNSQQTALYQAASGGDLKLCKYLLEKGANVERVTNKSESSILHAAIFGKNADVIKLILNAGCPVNTTDDRGCHPLLDAVSTRSSVEIIRLLIEAKSDLSIATKGTRQTALHKAICLYNPEAARLLIEHGSNMEASDCEGKSPLYLACELGLWEMVEYMVEDRGCRTSSSRLSALPIHAAASHGRARTLEVLARAGADLDQTNEKGETPLVAALGEDYFSAVRVLLQWGADLEAQHKIKPPQLCCLHQDDPHPHLGLEPLFLAMTHKNVPMMRMLLQCYRQIPRKFIKLMEVLLCRQVNSHYSRAEKEEILNLLHSAVCTPFSLSQACRRSIRACLGSPLQVKVHDLPVAEKVKDYILMVDEFTMWQEYEQTLPGGSDGFSNVFVGSFS